MNQENTKHMLVRNNVNYIRIKGLTKISCFITTKVVNFTLTTVKKNFRHSSLLHITLLNKAQKGVINSNLIKQKIIFKR